MPLTKLQLLFLAVLAVLAFIAFLWKKISFLKTGKVLHIGANILGAIFSGFLTARSIMSFNRWGNPTDLLFAATTAIEAILYLIRRYPKAFEPSIKETFICVIAAWGTLALNFAPGVVMSQWLGTAVLSFGLVLQLVAKIFLGRAYALFAANRGVVSKGPYAIIRHPIYLAYLFISIGFLLAHLSIYNVVIYAIVYAMQIWRILNEERLLLKSDEYQAYKQKVKWRLIPLIW